LPNYFEENNIIAGKYREEYYNKMYDNLTTKKMEENIIRLVYLRRIATLTHT
jgi:hypothetical protein